jgi:hypothetical protein
MEINTEPKKIEPNIFKQLELSKEVAIMEINPERKEDLARYFSVAID